MIKSLGSGGGGLRDNFDATVPPTANDDATQGYTKGSRWLNNATGILSVCLGATAGGARWEPLSPLDHPGYIADRYHALYEGAAASAAVPAADLLYLTPSRVKAVVLVKALALRVSTAGSADSAVKVGVWGSRGAKPFGPPLLVNPDGAPCSAAATVSQSVAGQLDPGVVWVGRKFSGGTLPSVIAHSPTAADESALMGHAALPTSTSIARAYTLASPYADAMPTLAETVTLGEAVVTGVPIVYFQAGS